ncbi:unnamed protein product [Effrenium voratum]|uniref:Radial spoke head 10 family protein n=1 Tax=Effrenium voratum TaxID=2562239 RepID=A0AA36HZC2_9DINO|nr:unnamed protein product [Effrenium voratum]
MSSSKRSKRKKDAKNKEVKKDLTPQFVNCDLADNKYSGIIREDLLGSQFLEGGSSTYLWSTGTKYEGPFVASQIEGKGRYIWPDGSKYEGELLRGMRNGEGSYQSQDGKTRYDGQWLDGKRHGNGKLTYSSDGPSFYDGGWQAGQKHGFGKQLWPSGNCYEGRWKMGKMHGHGTMIWRNGNSAEIYTGEWVDNYPHGAGTHTWLTLDHPDAIESWLNRPSPPPSAGQGAPAPSAPPQEMRKHEAQIHATQQLNNRYTGQWVWGRREGIGTFYYANGAYYHGEWKANVKEGHGRHTFDDGKVYQGSFEADRMVDSKPDTAKTDDNPVCGCTDISDLEMILRPSDKAGLAKTPPTGYADAAKILKGIFNVLLRNLGDLRESYARSRAVQPLLGEDPHVVTLVQFWSLARDAGILTPNSTISRFDRAVFSGPRHQSEVAPEDEQEIRAMTPRFASKESKESVRVPSSTSKSESVQAEESAEADDDTLDEEVEALCEDFDSPGASALGRKYLRLTRVDGNLVHIHSAARPLLFRHFLESFIRVAPVRFPNEPGLEQQVNRLFKEQVMPCIKNVPSQKTEGGGLISMLANFRRPTTSVFGLFTQPEVREVVQELEPAIWKTFVELSGDPLAEEAADAIPGGGIFAGSCGLGANPSNEASAVSPPSHSRTSASGADHFKAESICANGWAAPSRQLHVLARLNVGVRIKDVLRFLDSLGFLRNTQLLKEQNRPLLEVLSGSEGDSVNNLLGPIGSGLSQEPVEEENQSEDDEGSGGNSAPEEEEDRPKQLPGLSISFMPKGSLLGGGTDTNPKEESRKRKSDKDKKDKKEEKEVRTPAEDLATINLTIDAIDVIRILAQVLSPASLDLLRWQSEKDEEKQEVTAFDEHVSILEFVESEVVFAEFMRFLFLMAELTTRRDYKFCRSVSLTTRLDLFLRNVIFHCQARSRYLPPDPPGDKSRNPLPRMEVVKSDRSEAESPQEATPLGLLELHKADATEEVWTGYSCCDDNAPRRWLEGYDAQVAEW